MNYQSVTNTRIFEFSLGMVFASTPEEAEQFASAHGMWNKRPDGTWGSEASEAHAELSRDQQAAYRVLAARKTGL
jgi:hypothetical protein